MSIQCRSDAPPDIDPGSISSYCAAVFRYVEGNIPVRLLTETGTVQKQPQQAFPKVEKLANLLCSKAQTAANHGCGVYVVPCSVGTATSARAGDIRQTCVVVIDLDNGDIEKKRAHAVRHLGEPTLEIASGGVTDDGQSKCHLYWRLTEAAEGSDLERVRALRETLAIKLGGDTSFKSLTQPIRVAGTIHGKNGIKASVRILKERSLDYELEDLAEAVDCMPALEAPELHIAPGRDGKGGPSVFDLAILPIHAGGTDGLTRFAALSKVIGHWIRNVRRGGCSLDEAWLAVTQHNAAMIIPSWPEDRLHREFNALLRVDIRANGPMASDNDEGIPQDHAPDSSEDAIADKFAAANGSDWKHVAQWGSWFRWTGQVWSRDETGAVRELARKCCRAAAVKCQNPGQSRRVASDRTIAACLRIAASDPRIAARTSDWDGHPMLLNSPAGIIDLQSGEVLPHDPSLKMTQITTAAPSGDCPRWRKFLAQITGGNADLESYLRRLAGYCLTGTTQEQSLAFLHGDGANGKSVFLSTIAHVLGDYAATATLNTFMSARGTRHLTELAGLRAARLVMVPETEQGHSWAEARIKAVTGGERIRANFMRQDHFEFTPQFKLIVAGNHRPALSGYGEAMRRRLHLVPFEVTIPAHERDPRLGEKLKAERDGILNWLLQGCAEWQRIGLAPPECVLEAANAYFADEDMVGQWIAERCNEGRHCRAQSKMLFSSWKSWADEAGAPVGSAKAFGDALRQRGMQSSIVNRARGWIGLSLRIGSATEGAGK